MEDLDNITTKKTLSRLAVKEDRLNNITVEPVRQLPLFSVDFRQYSLPVYRLHQQQTYRRINIIMTAEATPKDGTAGGDASAADAPSAASAARPVVVYHMDVHSWMETQQTSHGVRHDDYAQYHAYCTRRMARLARKPSDAKQYLIHSGKYAPLPSGTGGKPKGGAHRHAFCSRSQDTFGRGGKGDADAGNTSNEGSPEASPRVAPHVNVLWYLLVSAERAWAHANELQRARNSRTGGGKAAAAAGKEGGGNNNNNNNNRRHQPVLRKLRRAHEWATLLLDMAEASADRSTQLECHAYRSWTAANYALEKMEYQVGPLARPWRWASAVVVFVVVVASDL